MKRNTGPHAQGSGSGYFGGQTPGSAGGDGGGASMGRGGLSRLILLFQILNESR